MVFTPGDLACQKTHGGQNAGHPLLSRFRLRLLRNVVKEQGNIGGCCESQKQKMYKWYTTYILYMLFDSKKHMHTLDHDLNYSILIIEG